MVHQHFMLVPSLTVTENILLGLDEPRFNMRLPEYHAKIAALQEQFGLQGRSRGQNLATLGRRTTTSRDSQDAVPRRGYSDHGRADGRAGPAGSGRTLCHLALHDGRGAIHRLYFSHKLHEVMDISNRITVLRKGRVAGETLATSSTNMTELAELMVGRKVLFRVTKEVCERGEAALQIESLHADNDKGLPALRGVSLEICSGEILGLAGVAGNGQSELAEVITGMRPLHPGRSSSQPPGGQQSISASRH